LIQIDVSKLRIQNFMTISIKHKITGATLFETKRADLGSADLVGADLVGADLRSADLVGANLVGADLRSANLVGANLRSADLVGANLRSADLQSADLRSADLEGVDLASANLWNAKLAGANLKGVAASLGIVVDPQLPAAIVARIEAEPGSWQQDAWHSSCGTRHCIAGFATVLSGALGKYLDKQLGTSTAATLLLWRPGAVMPSFAADATTDETLGRLKTMAASVADAASKS
jgi:hypothetical protein